MNKKLYIGNLPYSVTDDSLKETFSAAGTVSSAQVIIDKKFNRSKGFGFVEMATEEEAAKAVDMFDGKDMDGRTLKVAEAKPMREE